VGRSPLLRRLSQTKREEQGGRRQTDVNNPGDAGALKVAAMNESDGKRARPVIHSNTTWTALVMNSPQPRSLNTRKRPDPKWQNRGREGQTPARRARERTHERVRNAI